MQEVCIAFPGNVIDFVIRKNILLHLFNKYLEEKKRAQDGMKYELSHEHSLTSTLKFLQYSTKGGLMMLQAQFFTHRR
jgi:hypothetical protein